MVNPNDMMNFLMVLHIMVCLVLILVVLAFSLMPDKAPAEIIGSPSDLE